MNLYNALQGDFVLDWSKDNHREAIVNALADKYNAYHYELHKHYLKYASHEEAVAGRRSSVEPHVWEWLCERWTNSTFKVLMTFVDGMLGILSTLFILRSYCS